MSIYDIAERLYFSDLSSFARFITRMKGMSFHHTDIFVSELLRFIFFKPIHKINQFT